MMQTDGAYWIAPCRARAHCGPVQSRGSHCMRSVENEMSNEASDLVAHWGILGSLPLFAKKQVIQPLAKIISRLASRLHNYPPLMRTFSRRIIMKSFANYSLLAAALAFALGNS